MTMEELSRTVVASEVVMYVISYSLMIAAFALFLQECYKPNMILRRYYVWLNYLYIKNRRSKWVGKKAAKRVVSKTIHAMTKVFGLCIYCQATWLAIIISLWGYELNIAPQIDYLFLVINTIGMTYLFIKIAETTLNL